MEMSAAILPCGKRLHLQHGPIDLIIGAYGNRQTAFVAAKQRLGTILQELMEELPELRLNLMSDVPQPQRSVARRMDKAVRPFANDVYVTRMAAVAGSVADEVLRAMVSATPLTRAYVNNGGDIALHLEAEQNFSLAVMGHDGTDLGRIMINHDDPIRGIATSGRHGRSFSLGIADSVTVLAENAAKADVAATLIANTIDIPGHAAIGRKRASELDDTSDLGDLPVVTHCGSLSNTEISSALLRGRKCAHHFVTHGLISEAAMFLQGCAQTTDPQGFTLSQRIPIYA